MGHYDLVSKTGASAPAFNMPLIYMRHPVHGAKIANLEMEAEYDERSGWERYTPGVEDEQDDAPPVNTLGRRRRKEPEHVHSG